VARAGSDERCCPPSNFPIKNTGGWSIYSKEYYLGFGSQAVLVDDPSAAVVFLVVPPPHGNAIK
jgi:hypothetical protein